MSDSFPDDLNPYPKGEWKILYSRDTRQSQKSSGSTVIRQPSKRSVVTLPSVVEEDVKTPWDKVLRGPIWNYGRRRESGDLCYSDLLFGKSRKTYLTDVSSLYLHN